MGSLFLGKIESAKRMYEIHAFTNGYPFREIKAGSIADHAFNTIKNNRQYLIY
ncbi:MAG: hypothetical protein R6V04_15310 [bacterium]